jgi:hypothetical protein
MTDYSKMRCYDMRMYLFEWTSYNPEAGIKYIHNMSKSQLIQMCLYTEDRLSKDELVNIMIDVKNSLKENKKRLKNKKEDTKYDNSSNANVNKPVNIITINNAPETVYYTADEDDGDSSDNDKDDN